MKDKPEKKDEAKGAEVAKPLRVDLDGIARRVAAFPVPEGRYGRIAGIKGKVLWNAYAIAGSDGRGGHKETAGALEVFDFATLKSEVMIGKVDEFVLATDHTTLLVREGKRLRVLEAGKKPDAADAASSPSRKSGWIDLAGVKTVVERARNGARWLHEVWRLQRDSFWDAGMSGCRLGTACLARYMHRCWSGSRHVANCRNLIWELQGELGTSHAYEMLGDYRKQLRLRLSARGRFAWDGEAFRIAHLVRGDAWDVSSDSPLNAVGVRGSGGRTDRRGQWASR